MLNPFPKRIFSLFFWLIPSLLAGCRSEEATNSHLFANQLDISTAIETPYREGEGSSQHEPTSLITLSQQFTLISPDIRFSSIDISTDNKLIVGLSAENEVYLLDLESQEIMYKIDNPSTEKHSLSYNNVVFSPNKKMVAAGLLDGLVYVWRTVNGELLATLNGNAGFIYSVAFSPDNKFVAATHNDGSIHVWDLTNQAQASVFSPEACSGVTVVFSHDGRTLVSGSGIGSMSIWDLGTGRSVEKREGVIGSSLGFAQDPTYVFFEQDDRSIISVERGEGVVRFWQASELDWKLMKSVRLEPGMGEVRIVNDGEFLIHPTNQGMIEIWSLSEGKKVFSTETDPSSPKLWPLNMALSRDDSLLAISTTEGGIRLWSIDKSQ